MISYSLKQFMNTVNVNQTEPSKLEISWPNPTKNIPEEENALINGSAQFLLFTPLRFLLPQFKLRRVTVQ